MPETKNGDLSDAVLRSNQERLRRLLERLHEMDPFRFEHLVADLLKHIGYEDVKVTRRAGDGGLDVTAELTAGGVTRVKTAIQVKRWRSNVGSSVVRELRGSVTTDQRGLVITTADFTKDAREEAEAPSKTPVSLMDGKQLVRLLAKHGIGVKTKQLDYYELDLDALEPAEMPTEVATPKMMLRLWPIPGGRDNYVESTMNVLKHIRSNSPTEDKMITWMRQTFPRAKSAGVIQGYLLVFRTLGLVRFDGEKLVLTPEGEECLATDIQMVLSRQLRTRVVGILELESEIRKRPMTREEAWRFLNKTLHVDWKTDAQVKWRLIWMVAAGIIRKKGKVFESLS